MQNGRQFLEMLVLGIHRRNGGDLSSLDPNWRLLEPCLRLDSLDLAEVMATIERDFSWSPFESGTPPRTWQDVITGLEARHAAQS